MKTFGYGMYPKSFEVNRMASNSPGDDAKALIRYCTYKTMETLAYLHLSTAYEEPADLNPAGFNLILFKGFNWNKLPAKASVRFLALTFALLIVGMSSSAFALQRGDSGSQVATLQRNLSTAGYYKGPVTGFYGSLTQDAVSSFQRARGIKPDGIASSTTLAALEGRGGPDPNNGNGGGYSNVILRRGSSGTTVTQLQRTLTSRGYYSGPITGYFGRLTEEAVIRFQQANGLVADGVVGARTSSALGSYASGSFKRVSTNGSPLNVRSAPGGTIVGSLPNGSQVNLNGRNVNGWLQLANGNYVYSQWLS
ncbi:MAG TPA: peptidoglycan-binding protein [Coleofasciculaceae cyanobacterium]|jgi:peptidoglycan hydrolase-like protein with peptidoglycan-binding domain